MSALHFPRWHNCGRCVGQLQLVSIFCGYDVYTTISDIVSLYMVPGAPAPLTRICVGGNNLLLLYADDRARLWDVKTLEFWRSMDLEKVKELLAQGGWTELSVPLLSYVLYQISFREQVDSRFAFNGKRANHSPGSFP